jgi:alkylhydroperoxidase/carboxymuconolactone decarboxylase family protein YurZ
MGDLSVREAWVRIPSEEERRAQLPPGAPASAYNFGFIPAMARLQAAHDKIGLALGLLFRQLMFEAGHLSRQEREMVAAVAAAAQDCQY